MSEAQGQEVQVRIGELHVLGAGSCDRLIAVGLGSCVGVTIVHEPSGTCAMAHVFLPRLPPTGPRAGAGIGTYADIAIPELVRRVRRAADDADAQLVAIVVGGARMFAVRPGSDVGERNVEAVRAALAASCIPIVAEDVGGSCGRTLRVRGNIDVVTVAVRVVGAPERELWSVALDLDAARRAAA